MLASDTFHNTQHPHQQSRFSSSTAYPASTLSDRDSQYKQQRQSFAWDNSQNVHDFNPSLSFMPSTPHNNIQLQQLPTQMPHTPTSLASSSPRRTGAEQWRNQMEVSGSNQRFAAPQRNMLRNPHPHPHLHQRGPSNSSTDSRLSNNTYSQQMANSYPTPSYDTFNLVSGADQSGAPAYHYSRNDLTVPHDEMPQLSPSSHMHKSGRPSISSDFQGPPTPRTQNTDDFDHSLDASNYDTSKASHSHKMSHLEGMDEIYPASYHQPQQQMQQMARQMRRPDGMLSPSIDNYIRVANNEHLRPHTQPQQVFKPTSPFDGPLDTSTPKTISPKDTLLEATAEQEEEANLLPLFPVSQSPAPSSQQSSLGYGLADSRRPSASFSMGGFNAMNVTANNVLQSYPFVSRQQDHSLRAQAPPEFKVNMLRMETSGSDYSDVSKPSSTRADTGTYTCTYHGCTLRFETPQKLQKHKREGHRQNVGHAAVELTPVGSVRDSQAGPHICNRINPSTGKPCNTQFSRPYDLTRHEDTIHNPRKMKVRCELCTEEKTFSRNDALTRHMRVVHPEVDWNPKSRRKSIVN